MKQKAIELLLHSSLGKEIIFKNRLFFLILKYYGKVS